jgi:hypothetical protein
MNYNLLDSTEKLFAKALSTMRKKNADYAGDATSMRNFELSANVAGISMSKGILVRLMDKMTRIGNLMEKEAAVEDESIFDTIQDAINYSAILLHALRIEADKNKQKTEPYIPGMRSDREGNK